jgi:hypothetical protein
MKMKVGRSLVKAGENGQFEVPVIVFPSSLLAEQHLIVDFFLNYPVACRSPFGGLLRHGFCPLGQLGVGIGVDDDLLKSFPPFRLELHIINYTV